MSLASISTGNNIVKQIEMESLFDFAEDSNKSLCFSRSLLKKVKLINGAQYFRRKIYQDTVDHKLLNSGIVVSAMLKGPDNILVTFKKSLKAGKLMARKEWRILLNKRDYSEGYHFEILKDFSDLDIDSFDFKPTVFDSTRNQMLVEFDRSKFYVSSDIVTRFGEPNTLNQEYTEIEFPEDVQFKAPSIIDEIMSLDGQRYSQYMISLFKFEDMLNKTIKIGLTNNA